MTVGLTMRNFRAPLIGVESSDFWGVVGALLGARGLSTAEAVSEEEGVVAVKSALETSGEGDKDEIGGTMLGLVEGVVPWDT